MALNQIDACSSLVLKNNFVCTLMVRYVYNQNSDSLEWGFFQL